MIERRAGMSNEAGLDDFNQVLPVVRLEQDGLQACFVCCLSSSSDRLDPRGRGHT